MKVKDQMRQEVVTLDATEPLDVASDIMALGRIRHLPVVDGKGAVIGLVTQRDLFRATISSVLGLGSAKDREWLGKIHVLEVMTAPVVTVSPDTALRDALERMLLGSFGCLPVVADGVLVGLLTETDCLRALRDLLEPRQ